MTEYALRWSLTTARSIAYLPNPQQVVPTLRRLDCRRALPVHGALAMTLMSATHAVRGPNRSVLGMLPGSNV